MSSGVLVKSQERRKQQDQQRIKREPELRRTDELELEVLVDRRRTKNSTCFSVVTSKGMSVQYSTGCIMFGAT